MIVDVSEWAGGINFLFELCMCRFGGILDFGIGVLGLG